MEKNIYQRMLEVQKKVQSVQKNETVEMFGSEKKYKAVSHDDVAALLHLPLAEAGIVLLPSVTKYATSEFVKTNQWNKETTWYRTDIDISVKWINADKPDDFIESTGAAFALDTSDKSFAKAYSLALKIVLLKVHLLESRDDEEKRTFEQVNGVEEPKKSAKGESKPRQDKTEKQDPKDIQMPFGQAKGKKLGELTTETLTNAQKWLKAQMDIDPAPKNIKQVKFIYAMVKSVLEGREENTPPAFDYDQDPGQVKNYAPQS